MEILEALFVIGGMILAFAMGKSSGKFEEIRKGGRYSESELMDMASRNFEAGKRNRDAEIELSKKSNSPHQ